MGDNRPPATDSRRTRLGWYVSVALVGLLLPLIGYRCDSIDLRAPLLYDEDVLLILPMVKATLERGSHWRTEQFGAPGIQEMHDFPVIDHLNFAIIWCLGRFHSNPVVAFNLFYLLTYPLAALSAMAVLRRFGLSFPASAVGGLLFCVLPYHYFRGQAHYFLSAYYFVPITSAMILELARGRLPFFRQVEGRWQLCARNRYTLGSILICVLTSMAGAYYAFFAAALLVGAGLYSWAAGYTWRAMLSAGLLLIVIFLAGVANHIPTFYYQYRFGYHSGPTERFSEESEYYSLKLTQLILPIDDHRIQFLADLKQSYNSFDRPVQTVSERYTLGLIGSIGLLLLLARCVLPVSRRSPYAELSALTLLAYLIGTVSGIGAIFNHLVSPQVRCYNRIAIYIAFFALYAVLHTLDELGTRLRKRAGATLVFTAWLAVGIGGILDQTPYRWGDATMVESIRAQQERFAVDAEFYRSIEGQLNPDGVSPVPMLFQLPYVRWPESPPVRRLGAYEHARGYIHTRNLRWSYGTMKGREIDEWYRQVAILPVEQLLERVAAAGFEGLILDKRGYTAAKGELLDRQLSQVLGNVTKIEHPDRNQIYFDLRDHRGWLRNHYGPGWEQRCDSELNRVRMLWLDGFYSFKEDGYEWQQRWCRPKALALFANPTDETKTFQVTFTIRTITRKPLRVSIRGGDIWTEEIDLEAETTLTRSFAIPPGRHPIRFQCNVPKEYVPSDSRWLMFSIHNFRLE